MGTRKATILDASTLPTESNTDIGQRMFSWAEELYPICRSITGRGTRQTLNYIKQILPSLAIHEVPTGTKAFDWEVPKEWNIKDAYIQNESGERIIDFKDNNLHVVGYSTPIDTTLSLEELNSHLHSLPDQPEAIPYVTSYYHETWGFCLTHNQRESLKAETYKVKIDSELKAGSLTYGELILKGKSKKEVLLSTYICHPSMANNELSGPCLATALAEWLSGLDRKYTYRILFLPETIGAITYLSKHLEHMQQQTIAGFVLTCVGDDNNWSFMPSRIGNTYADRIAKRVLEGKQIDFKAYNFQDRGSDERQYCSPLVDLPVVSIMRSKYHEYPEYHTSLDDLSFISARGLKGSFELYQFMIQQIEVAEFWQVTNVCEPQLGKRGLYPTTSTKETKEQVKHMMDVLAYADGKHDLLDISVKIGISPEQVKGILCDLASHRLVREA